MTAPEGDHSNCILCQIVKGESPVSLVYQNAEISVFPTIEPVNPGHILIIPVVHAPSLNDLEEGTAARIMIMARKVALAIRKSALKCEGINLFVADGEAAGQDVFHFHLHVYPRFKDDGFGFKYDKSRHFVRAKRPELDEIAQEIRSHLK
jgi:histidine triad (HIT) family protein